MTPVHHALRRGLRDVPPVPPSANRANLVPTSCHLVPGGTSAVSVSGTERSDGRGLGQHAHRRQNLSLEKEETGSEPAIHAGRGWRAWPGEWNLTKLLGDWQLRYVTGRHNHKLGIGTTMSDTKPTSISSTSVSRRGLLGLGAWTACAQCHLLW